MTSPVLVENRSGRTCGCALTNVRHAMEDPKKRLGAAVGVAAATAWYGLPDVVRCRGARAVIKAGLLAAVGVAAATAWYGLPDVVRCRGARAVIKAGLLAAVMWSATAQMPPAAPVPPYPDEESDCDGTPAPKGDDPLEGVTEAAPGELALLAGAGIGTVCLTVAVEKWLFRRGERRRAAGVRLAHTRQGLVIGALTGAASAVQFAVAAPAD